MLLYYSLAAFLSLVDHSYAASSAAAAPSAAAGTGTWPPDLIGERFCPSDRCLHVLTAAGTWSSKSRSVLTGPVRVAHTLASITYLT